MRSRCKANRTSSITESTSFRYAFNLVATQGIEPFRAAVCARQAPRKKFRDTGVIENDF